MFKFIFLALLSTSAFADNWTTGDTYREVAFQTLNVIDWGQTRYTAQHPESFHEKELANGGSSEFIGSHPTVSGVDSFMLKVSVLHYGISRTLLYFNLRDWHEAFQYITIGAKLDATTRNVSIGIGTSF